MSNDNKTGKIQRVGAFLTLPMLRDLVVVLILGIFAWKLLNSEIALNLEKFGFTDLLSVLLAFFAMGMAVAFYFKATETSNRFYDNIYNFTKDTSEMLGRIESGFGERLKRLDEGYIRMGERIQNMPSGKRDADAKKKIKDEEEVIDKAEEERKVLINQLIERAKFQTKEEERFISKLKEEEQKLTDAHKELARLKRRAIIQRVRQKREQTDHLKRRGFREYAKDG